MLADISVAVLLVFYKSEKHIDSLFSSLRAQSFKSFRIYAIENTPSLTAVTKLSESFPKSVVLPSQGNIGFARGNNLLAKKAIEEGCKYLFILNPDMELTENSIGEFYNLLENNNNAAACSGILLFGNEKKEEEIIQLFGQKINYFSQHKEFLFTLKKIKEIALLETLRVDFTNGGSLFIRSKTVEEIGLFNEDYFMYNDEMDLAYRIKKSDKSVLVTSRTKIFHHHDWSEKNEKGNYLMYYYMMRNRMLFFKKYKLFFNLIIDVFKQIITSPITVNWLIRLAGYKLVYFYYLGLWRGLTGETGKTNTEFK